MTADLARVRRDQRERHDRTRDRDQRRAAPVGEARGVLKPGQVRKSSIRSGNVFVHPTARVGLGQSCVIQYRDRETAKGGLERAALRVFNGSKGGRR